MRKFSLFCLFFVIAFGGCASNQGAKDSALYRVGLASSSMPGFVLPAGALFAWHPNGRQSVPVEGTNISDATAWVEDAVIRALAEKGHRFTGSSSRADMLVAYVIAGEAQLSDRVIVERFGVLPGLQSNKGDLANPKGSLVLLLVDKASGKVVWRGVGQAFVSSALTVQERQYRIASGVRTLLGGVPTQ